MINVMTIFEKTSKIFTNFLSFGLINFSYLILLKIIKYIFIIIIIFNKNITIFKYYIY